MKQNTHKEKIALIFAAAWITIVGMRYVTLVYLRAYHTYPGLFIRGFHFHHLYIGLGCFLFALGILVRSKKAQFFFALLAGFGLGLIFDELGLVLARNFSPYVYWGDGSFLVFIIFAVLSFLVFKLFKNPVPYRISLVPLVIVSFILMLIFSWANPTFTHAKRIGFMKNKFVALERNVAKIKTVVPKIKSAWKKYDSQ